MKMKKKLFIIGIGGLTGHKIAQLAKNNYELFGSYNNRNPKFEFVDQYHLDLKDFNKFEETINKINPDFIINTSGINNVDYCEDNKELAFKINTNLVEQLTNFCKVKNIKLIQLSTDSVFDGNKIESYTEEDIPNPINVYGETKYQAEKIVLTNPKNLVIRASVLYGWLPKKLTLTPSSSMKSINFSQWLISKLENNETVQIVQDEYSSPIIVDDFVKSIIHLIKTEHSGIFHSGPNSKINRFEFCKKIAQEFNFNSELIIPTTVKQLGRKVPTGSNKSLNSKKLSRTNFKFLTIEESIKLLKEQRLE